MGRLLDLALYNPARLNDEDFLAGFVARRHKMEQIVGRLREIELVGLAQHRLIVGHRGMGKTSLLRRIGLAVRRDPELSAVLVPLSFREEQYNVHTLHAFWRNCLDSLGDYFESRGELLKARQLDAETAALEGAGADGSQAADLFRDWLRRERRRPLLLIDNIDIVVDGLPRDGWNLRRALQERGGIVVIGASTRALEAAVHPEAPFYEFFQVDLLEHLSLAEVNACLRRLASLRGDGGLALQRRLARDPARVEVLHDLTGGNPRTLAMLYLVLEENGEGDVMADLERLLDQATPLYKARVEQLAPQARVVFDALALQWDPATAAALAAITRLDTSSVSTQLDRLSRDGIVEKTSLSSTKRAGFQVSERFFNIWYLMRHGPRRQRQRLRWLAESLRCLYSPAELEMRARAIIEDPAAFASSSGSYWLAFSDALGDGPLKSQLASRAARNDAGLADGLSVEDPVKTAALRRTAEQPGDRASAWHELATYLAEICQFARAEAAFRRTLEIDRAFLPGWESLGRLLGQAGRLDEAEEVQRRILEIEPNHLEAWKALASLLAVRGDFEESELAWQRIAELDPVSSLPRQILALLKRDDGRYSEAEAVLREALERDPGTADLWSLLGNLLADQLGRLPEAEEALGRAAAFAPGDPFHQANLAYLLLGQGRREAANEPYRAAVAALPPHGAALLEAFRHLAEGSPERAFGELAAALGSGHPELLTIFRDDLLRCLRLAARRGWGDLALRWLDDSGLGDRYRAIRVAYEAFLHGRERLMDVSPEVRAGARRICHELAGDPSRPAQP